ncbi:MAG: peptidoglycan-binding domain-containing protein [Alteraurantiacibacter sp.]
MISTFDAAAEEGPEAALEALQQSAEAASLLSEAEQIAAYRDIGRELDRFIANYPESDLAVDILLRRSPLGLDLSAIYGALRDARDTGIATRRAAAPAAPAPLNPAPPKTVEQPVGINDAVAALPNFFPTPESGTLLTSSEAQTTPGAIAGDLTEGRDTPPSLSAGTETTEAALGMDRQTIREIQARLFLSGYDPRGIDGIIGNGTRDAIRSWQAQKGLVETGYLSAPLLRILQSETSSTYPIWLKEQKAVKAKAKQRITRGSGSGLPKGWFRDREGKYCRKVQFGLTMCQPYPP